MRRRAAAVQGPVPRRVPEPQPVVKPRARQPVEAVPLRAARQPAVALLRAALPVVRPRARPLGQSGSVWGQRLA